MFSSKGSSFIPLMVALAMFAAIVSAFAYPDHGLHGKEGWNWGKKVGGESKHGHAHGYGEVHADPKVGHSWVHGLEVKGGPGHYGHGHGHDYGSGYVKVVKLVRRNENHGGHMSSHHH